MSQRQGEGPTERRTQQQRVEESARRLAAAAVELIVEKGYSHTTAKDISLRAGYSRAMVAERYGSKEALLDALMNQYEGRIVVDVDPDASGFDQVMAPLDAMVRFERDDPTFLRAMFVISFEAVHDAGALRDRIREWLMRFRQGLKAGIEEGQQDGSVSAQVDADDLSREILTSGVGYAYWWVVVPYDIDFSAMLARWRERIASSLRPTE